MQSRFLIYSLLWTVLLVPAYSFSLFTAVEKYDAVNTVSAPTKPIEKGLGQLKKVEDAGYPMVVLTLEMAQGGVETFNLNLEEVKTFNLADLNNAISKELAVEYDIQTKNDLLSLRCNGKSVFATEGYKKKRGLRTVKGILSNAEHTTAGDLPDDLLIKTVEEVTYHFPFYITEEIVAVNGKEVVGYYTEYTNNHITSIRLTGE